MANTHSIDFELDSSQYLSITDASQTGLDVTGDLTIEMWIKLETLPSDNSLAMSLVFKYDAGAGERAYAFQITSADLLRALYSDAGSGGNFTISRTDSAIPFSTGEWNHVAVSIDVSVPSIKFYVNGSEVASTHTDTSATSINNSAAAFHIGASNNPDDYFDGKIDDVRVWSAARTAQEIAANYTKELVGNEANLVGYWKLNNSLLDETSNNNDLTNNNSATFVSGDVPYTETEFGLMF